MTRTFDLTRPPSFDPSGVYDEMASGQGRLRPHWQSFMGTIGPLDSELMAQRWDEARKLLRQNGVTYNIYGDPQGMERPWPLDMIPLLIPTEEWRVIEDGVRQRVQLLNAVLVDLYGPQTLIHRSRLPAALLYSDPGFRRPCQGATIPNNVYLHFCAVDLARSPDGSWWVLADRTIAPSGSGYALENRGVISKIMPDSFRHLQVERLGAFFTDIRDMLFDLAARCKTQRSGPPRVTLLTPGPYNETYFEHAFLARTLGLTLVEGGDLAVRDRRVFLKTLSGLEPVDVILRRLDDAFCDPLELRADSSLGVAGLLEAVRAGTVVVANALGSGLMESASFKSFLPSLCRHLLGEELKLPSLATWWCGQPTELNYVANHIEQLVIKAAHGGLHMEPIFGSSLSPTDRAALVRRMRRHPWDFVGQERMQLSTAPVWENGRLEPRPLVLRVYLAARGNGDYSVMPGGLTRVSNHPEQLVVSMQRGGGSKDTWVLRTPHTERATPSRLVNSSSNAGNSDSRPPPSPLILAPPQPTSPVESPIACSGSVATPNAPMAWCACCAEFMFASLTDNIPARRKSLNL
ncbi:glutamate---cysteine ligase / carboxylate-amine ligase [Azospirillaceae bacterium]